MTELKDLSKLSTEELKAKSEWAKSMAKIGSAKRSLKYTKLYTACDNEIRNRT